MTPNLDKIIEYYNRAREKHPNFCDMLLPLPVVAGLDRERRSAEYKQDLLEYSWQIKWASRYGSLLWSDLLSYRGGKIIGRLVEGAEVLAKEEAYKAIATLLRLIDVLDGRQKLGPVEM